MDTKALTLTSEPEHGTLFAVDVVGFGSLRNPEQLAIRRVLYRMLSASFDAGGVPWRDCYHEDRGDGALVVIGGNVPKTLLLDHVLSSLIGRISAQGAGEPPPLRLKMAVHAGEMHRDENGLVGFDVNHMFRLLESELVRYAIRTVAAPCALIVSDPIYQSVIRHGYGAIATNEYARARVVNKEDDSIAWLRMPGNPRGARKAVNRFVREQEKAKERADSAQPGGGVTIRAGGDFKVGRSIIAGRDATVSGELD